MRSIRIQYLLSFAVMGSLLPFLSVYLKDNGLTRWEIGVVSAAASVAVVLTPVVVTLLADGWFKGRHLLAGAFALSGLMLALMLGASGFVTILVLLSLYSLAFAPTTALQDGFNFLVQSQRQASGEGAIPYHRVRVWGTIGFIAPSVLLFEFLRRGYPTHIILLSAVLFCLLGLVNTLSLPDTAAPDREDPLGVLGRPGSKPDRLPTLDAARAMFEPHVLVFCIGMILLHMASAAYYAFYPLYLTDRVGLDAQWVGVIANVGVGLEILYMLGFGWFMDRLGLKRLMILGAGCIVARFSLLAASDSVVVAVGTQLVHGLMVLVVHVAPPMFLNRHAGDRYRNSIQGLYTMAVFGSGRILGNLLAGYVSQVSLSATFAAAGVLSGLALLLFVSAFHETRRPSGPSA